MHKEIHRDLQAVLEAHERMFDSMRIARELEEEAKEESHDGKRETLEALSGLNYAAVVYWARRLKALSFSIEDAALTLSSID